MENKKYDYIVKSCSISYGDLYALKTLQNFLKEYSDKGWRVILLTRISSTFYEVVFEKEIKIVA